ncbi:MAG TPA: tripartite tricarboxylate transporter substrate binding protein, partial [Ramlibacter sp.]|nr:tripartite tricarboxylate transporter substrate binding protein [Ramlibacter sp.]
ADVVPRLIQPALEQKLGQRILIEHRPGAGGNVGAQAVLAAPADGHTMLMAPTNVLVINQFVFRDMKFDPLVDFVPISLIAEVPLILQVHPSVPAQTLGELIAHAKANPGKLNYGSTGIGTSSHLSGYMLSKRTGADYTHIPYKGAEVLKDLLAGRVQFMFATIPSVIAHINAGTLRPVAVTSVKRSRSMPNVPTVVESGFPDFEAGSWFGFFAPKGTPEHVIATVNKAVNEALPALEAQMVREGADPVGGSPAQFGQFIRSEYEKWKVVVRESGATAE